MLLEPFFHTMLFSEDPRRRSHRKKGPPRKAVTMPTGTWVGRRCASVWQNTRNVPPKRMVAGAVLSDFDGEPVKFSQDIDERRYVLCTANHKLHAKVLNQVAEIKREAGVVWAKVS